MFTLLALLVALGPAVMGLSIKGPVRVLMTEQDGTVLQTAKVGLDGKTGRLQKLRLDHSQELHLAVDLDKSAEGFKAPQQAFLRLKHEASGVSSFLPGAQLSNGTITWKATSAFVAKQIGTYGDAFSATLLLGGNDATGVRVELGSVSIQHTPLSTGAQPPQPAPQAVIALSQPKPEIIHMHRPADKRPPVFMALVFTVISLLPLVALVGYLQKIGANVKLFKGTVATTGLVFHGCVGALAALYSLFWLRLNLLQTLPWVAILGLTTAVSGYFHLNNVSCARSKSVKGKKDD